MFKIRVSFFYVFELFQYWPKHRVSLFTQRTTTTRYAKQHLGCLERGGSELVLPRKVLAALAASRQN